MPRNLFGLVQRDQVTIVRIRGKYLVDRPEVDELGQSLSILADDQGRVRLLLDFANVDSVSVAVFPILVLLRKHLVVRGGELAVCGLEHRVRELIAFAGLERLLNVHDTEGDALLSFA